MEELYYLKTSHACNLFSICVCKLPKKEMDYGSMIVFTADKKPIYEDLANNIKKCMKNFWENGKFHYEGPQNYWYVTTGTASHLKKLDLIQQKTLISEEDHANTCPMNFFVNESDAQSLRKRIAQLIEETI